VRDALDNKASPSPSGDGDGKKKFVILSAARELQCKGIKNKKFTI